MWRGDAVTPEDPKHGLGSASSSPSQLRRVASIASDFVGTPDQAPVRSKYLARQKAVAEKRANAGRTERLRRLRIR